MTHDKKVIRTDTGPGGTMGETGPFSGPPPQRSSAETEYLAPITAAHPKPRASSESGRSTITELRDLCEAALLAPMDSPNADPDSALERRPGKAPSPRQPTTAARLADELVRRIKAMPQLRARIVAQLIADAEPAQAVAEVRGTDSQTALKELRAVRSLLDNLGCPRSEDDRHLTAVERIRWLLDVLTASHQAGEQGRGTLPMGDNTPATGRRTLADS